MATHPNPLRCITIVSPSPSPSSPSSSSATSHHRHHHYGNGSILNGGNEAGLSGLMRVIKIAPRGSSYGALFHAILVLAFLLPFVFILAAVVTLEGVDSCSSFDCLGRRLGPKFLGRSRDNSAMELMDRERKRSRLAEQLHKHLAASAIPKGIHCLSLRLTDEYSSNAYARKQLPPQELLPLLTDNSYQHFVLATDNVLAASVAVNSAVASSSRPERIVFHVITDKKTYPGMHSWFALYPIYPVIVKVKGVHQFDWLTRENVPVLEAIENHHAVRSHYHGNHIVGTNVTDNPKLFPNLDKVVFLDDDVVIQRDLSPLWEIDLEGKVNGAVETCNGEDGWVMSKRFRTYFNFSHPLIFKNLDPDECAWAFGMNVFDLAAWRKTNIRDAYHYWVKKFLMFAPRIKNGEMFGNQKDD